VRLQRGCPVDHQPEMTFITIGQASIYGEIFLRHAARRKALLELLANAVMGQLPKAIESPFEELRRADDQSGVKAWSQVAALGWGHLPTIGTFFAHPPKIVAI
jgi:hypothetical protein